MKHLSGASHFNQTATGTTSAVATEGTPTAGKIYITDIVVSSDKNGALLQVKQGGTPVVFQLQLSGSGTPIAFSHHFDTPIIIDESKNATVEIDGTALCKANFCGYVA